MITVEYRDLPPGLLSWAAAGKDGLVVRVATALDPEQRRAAARLAVRAGRGAGWPVPLAAAEAAVTCAAVALWRRVVIHPVSALAGSVVSAVAAMILAAALAAGAPGRNAPAQFGGAPPPLIPAAHHHHRRRPAAPVPATQPARPGGRRASSSPRPTLAAPGRPSPRPSGTAAPPSPGPGMTTPAVAATSPAPGSPAPALACVLVPPLRLCLLGPAA